MTGSTSPAARQRQGLLAILAGSSASILAPVAIMLDRQTGTGPFGLSMHFWAGFVIGVEITLLVVCIVLITTTLLARRAPS
jgi:hypothetical protein